MSSTDSLVMERRSPRSPLLKSSFPKSPLPKSPFPKSPMPKSPVLYEKYKSRCAYSFISFFHFRQRHSKKLLSDRRPFKRHDVGDGFTSNNHDMLCHSIDDEVVHMTVTVDSTNAEVKKITDDTPIEQQLKKVDGAMLDHAKSDSEHVNSREYKRVTKTRRRHRLLPIYGCYDVATMGHAEPVHDNLVDTSSRKSDSEVLSNQVPSKNINCALSDQLNEVNDRIHTSQATEAFINQKLIDGKHLSGAGPHHHSKHFMDILEILNSNKALFIKLLQDPNSLLVKHIEDLRESQAKNQQIKSFNEAKLSEDQTSSARECETDPQSLDKIVVLQPDPTNLEKCDDGIISNDSRQFHCSLRNVHQSVRPAFFPYEKMKRKLLNAMGVSRKEKQLMLTDAAVNESTHVLQGFEQCSRGASLGIVEKISHEEASFDIGGMTIFSEDCKRKYQMEKVKTTEVGVVVQAASTRGRSHENSNSSICKHPKRCKHEMYVESRVHLSELLQDGNANFFRRLTPKTGDGMSSASGYRYFPLESGRRKREDGFFTPQMRFSPYNNCEMLSRNKWKHQRENKYSVLSPPRQNTEIPPWDDAKKLINQVEILESKLNISEKLFPDEKVQKTISFLDDGLSPGDFASIVKANNCAIAQEISRCRVLSEQDDPQNSCASEKAYYKANTRAKNGSLDYVRLDLPAENQTETSSKNDYASSPSSIQRIESFTKVKDRLEQPSPVSVLEQFSVEDTSSSFSTESQPSEPSVLPQQIGTEEHYLASHVQFPLDMKINLITSMEEHGSMPKCVCTVLQDSGFDLEELVLKHHLSGQLLDQSCDNHKLLCDYFLEVLLELYQSHLRFSSWVSFFEKMRLVSMGENVFHDVMKHVNWDPVLKPSSRTLEQLVEKDLAKPRTWMDIRIEIEEIVNAMVESTLEELIIEGAAE